MKICLFSPYIPKHTGGGEKYLLDVAQYLAIDNDVVMAVSESQFTSDADIKKKYLSFIQQPLTGITFISSPLGSSASVFKKMIWTAQFDVLYYLTDGSLFFSLARKNILHVQIPFTKPLTLLERLKLLTWQVKNTNSTFTKSIIEKSWKTKVDVVHHPLVELKLSSTFSAASKQPVILSVGRFFKQLHSKRQDVLVDLFKQLLKKYPSETKGWKLVLVGAVEDEEYVKAIKKVATGFPIEFYHNLSRRQLTDWYEQASIYWHAAGFGVNPEEYPEKVEHFGISTAEAMLAHCAPVVLGKGGQPEVVGSQLASYLWQTEKECLAKTAKLLLSPAELAKAQKVAHQQALTFGSPMFNQKLHQMIES